MKKMLLLALTLLVSLTVPAGAQTSAGNWANAMWVWDEPDAHKIAQNNNPRYLRLTFELAARPAAAELWITVDNQYVAYVNGHKVGQDGEWTTVEKYDVARYLVAGKNVLAIQATNQGGVAGALARLRIVTAAKKQRFIVTDDKTKITQQAGKDWMRADYDDAGWFQAVVLGDPSIGPWNIAGNATAQVPGKGPNSYGFNAVDRKVTKPLSAQEQVKHFVVPKDFEIELVAADPVIINPITLVLDDQGRIIVSESHTYRYGQSGSPVKPFRNPVVRLDPDGKGGFTRTLVADGFADPVMGIAVKGNKLWLTACDYLYTYDLADAPPEKGKGIAINKKAILIDKNKAWNPFGMFVLEWGPEGKLYMSVGNHNINIQGPDGKISARGGSGMVMRMNPDGTKMERLVHGLRVPYSFEYDPFGQLWLLSNGEGNPDRFVRVIEGIDYHCYSRGVDNNWLAGRHPLAPPCEEVHGGAHTQLLRYYAAAYPQEYQGNLFACNWGRHGFAGANRGIFRFVLDERNNVVKKDTLVACTDPHFRPSHIHLDVDGSLLIADWYGRDDESDKTGRIWRLKYVGKDRPVVEHKLDAPEWKDDAYALTALGSPHHLIREKAKNILVKRNRPVLRAVLGIAAAQNDNPLLAANALWTIVRMDMADGMIYIPQGTLNRDWRVRRLATDLVRRYEREFIAVLPHDALRRNLKQEKDPAVLNQYALTLDVVKRRAKLLEALHSGAAADPHLRYEAAWHLARNCWDDVFSGLLGDEDADVRLAGLIAIDIACYESFLSKEIALKALARAIENPGKLDHQLLLTVAQLDGDASIVPALTKLIARDDLPAATIARAVLVLKAKSGGGLASAKLGAAAGKRLVEAVEKGALKVASPADQLVLFEFLESEGPTPFALKQIQGQLRSPQPALKQAAHTLARRFGPKASPLAGGLWPSVLDPKTKFADTVEYLSTIARVEVTPNREAWWKLLVHDDPLVRTETVRWWRNFKDDQDMVGALFKNAAALLQKDQAIKDDLAMVYRHLGLSDDKLKARGLPVPDGDKEALAKYALQELAALPAADRGKRAAMGLQVFERNACTKCHMTATQTTLLAPSLKGIGGQKVEYLIESVLYPSKIIKTGFEQEVVALKSGKVLNGLVKDEGKFLRILSLNQDERVSKDDVDTRTLSKTSVMPDGQEATLSRREFVDLIAYLQTLK
jgi:putative membrane-bound dehydrogenase-like protein